MDPNEGCGGDDPKTTPSATPVATTAAAPPTPSQKPQRRASGLRGGGGAACKAAPGASVVGVGDGVSDDGDGDGVAGSDRSARSGPVGGCCARSSATACSISVMRRSTPSLAASSGASRRNDR